MKAAAFALIVLAAVGLAYLRINGHTSPAYQATAHLYVGLLVGLAIGRKRRFYWIVAAVLSVVEIIAFLVSKGIL